MTSPTRKSSYTGSIKVLMTTLSLAITLMGWAILARQDKPKSSMIPQPAAISTLPLQSMPNPAVIIDHPTMVAQPTLRVVNIQNIAPVVTRSSR